MVSNVGSGLCGAADSYTFLAVSVIDDTILIAAAAFTVATWTAATTKSELFDCNSTHKSQYSLKSKINN